LALVVFEAIGIYALSSAPATVSLNGFDADYRGEAWIAVTGRLAVEIADRGWVDTEEDEAIPDAAAAEVPIVALDDRPADPLCVVLYTEKMPRERLDGYLSARARPDPQTFVGRARPITHLHREAARLGGRTLASNAVFLYEDAWHERIRLGAAVAGFALGGVSLVLLVQAVQRRIPGPKPA
jgi:hypothetical protein